MKRRGLLRWVLAFGSFLFAALVNAAPSTRPNIVVMLADDWGFSDVGSFGSEIATPNLDALAQGGTRFSNFHVSASCSPTRAMLLTGVDNHRNGVGNMRESIPQSHVGKPGYLSVLDTNVVTVANLLRDSGYHTYASGKWHVGKEPHNLPPARGFERSLVQGDSGSDNWLTAQRYLDLTDKVNWYEDGKPANMPAEYYSSEYFVNRAIEFIQSGAGDGKPFFTYLAFQANHIPVQAPKEFIDRYSGKYKDGWTALRERRRDRAIALGLIPKDTPMVTMSTTENWDSPSETDKALQSRRMEVYAGMAEAMDFQVGRLVTYLRETGQFDNTVFMFLSDNGAEASDPYKVLSAKLWLKLYYSSDIKDLGARGAYSIIGPSWASAAASPLSTYKFYSGEGGIRVPLIISGVPGMPANQIHQSFTHVKDLAATVLDIANIPQNQGLYQGQKVERMTGTSLLPVLMGRSDRAHALDEPIGYELSGNQALFKGDLKLIKVIPPVGDGLWHLYNIRRDPGEVNDLASQMPEEFKIMQAQYADYAKANGVLPMPEGYDPIQQVQINALVNVYVPRAKAHLPQLLLFLSFFTVAALLWRRKRRIAQSSLH